MKTRILIIDDDDNHRERLVRAFAARGYEVRSAADGFSAAVIARTFAPHRALLDLQMAGDDGLTVLHKLLAEHAELKVVILTGYGSIASALEAIRGGAIDYLTKPADADQILAAFENPGGRLASKAGGAEVPSLDRVEWEHMHRVLSECGGNVSKAARRLRIHRRTLQRKLEKLPPAG